MDIDVNDPRLIAESRKEWLLSAHINAAYRTGDDWHKAKYAPLAGTPSTRPVDVIASPRPAPSKSNLIVSAAKGTAPSKPASMPPPKAAPPPKPAPPRWRVEGFTSAASWSAYHEGVARGSITPARASR